MTYVKQRWTSQTALTFFSWGSRMTAGLCRSRGVLPLACICLDLLLKGRAFCSSLGMWRGLKCRTCLTTGCGDSRTGLKMKRTTANNNNNYWWLNISGRRLTLYSESWLGLLRMPRSYLSCPRVLIPPHVSFCPTGISRDVTGLYSWGTETGYQERRNTISKWHTFI